jgi:hypothetical protein
LLCKGLPAQNCHRISTQALALFGPDDKDTTTKLSFLSFSSSFENLRQATRATPPPHYLSNIITFECNCNIGKVTSIQSTDP